VAGLFIGNNLSDRKKTSPDQLEKLDNFWLVIDNMLNSFLFILIGLELTSRPFNHGAFWVGAAGIVIVTFARLVSISLPITVIDK
ncbi:sodium:proton antiporter, partial [Francisella tularensis subsp. holarctica]|nr:sodium:proton antiporter [Francisella tularensis subsp. holarctica]